MTHVACQEQIGATAELLPLLIWPAVLVWSRALGLLTPLSSKLGAMLYIVRRAAEEVGVLVSVILVLMLVSMHMWTMACGLHLLLNLRST
jgi:hypothetical protein